MTSSMILPASEKQKVRLDFLDGLRGFAALFVVLHHIWLVSFIGADNSYLPRWFHWMTPLKFGHYAVGVFIVLSGYCLMVPISRSGSGQLPHGVWEYLKRRARRILPAYYAALVLSLLLIAFIPGLRSSGGTKISDYSAPDMVGAILSHLVLAHNLNPLWTWRINAPMWSVATEWQIYFIFPFLLLPLRRRMGLAVPIIAGILLGICSLHVSAITGACYWYIGLFAMGMASAELSFSAHLAEKVRHCRWGWISAILTCIASALILHYSERGTYWTPWTDAFLGLSTASFLVWGAHSLRFAQDKPQPILIRLLSSRVAVVLGGFSYSLYLTHYPLLQIAVLVCKHMHMTTPQAFLALTFAGLPVFLGLAYLFHVVFDRPFANVPVERKTVKNAQPSLA